MAEEIFSKQETTKDLDGRQVHRIVEGQSLATLAREKYGDPRFAKLIFTVNRGEIPLFQEGNQTFALIKTGQEILLPTNQEAKVFRRNFFTESTRTNFDLPRYARPASRAGQVVDMSRQANFNATALGSEQCAILLDLNRLTKSPQCAPAQALRSSNSTGFPPQKRPKESTFKFKREEEATITKLSSYCRVLKYTSQDKPAESLIYLQIFNQTNWETIATYLVQTNQAKRVKHFCDGSSQETNLKLPANLAGELSEKDFLRNWRNYTEVYFNHKEKVSLKRVLGNEAAGLWAL